MTRGLHGPGTLLPRAAGALLLALSIGAALLMVLDHFGGLALPGCGEGSPCGQAAASIWGKVPGIGWPVSCVGLAYFGGLLAGWCVGPVEGTSALRWVTRAGGAVSLFYMGLVVFADYRCLYCIASHVGNLGFWALLEYLARSRRAAHDGAGDAAAAVPARRGRASVRGPAVVIAGFLVITAVLALVESQTRRTVRAVAERQLIESTGAIIAATHGAEASSDEPVTLIEGENGLGAEAAGPAGAGRFSARYRLGPELAAIRIVVYEDFMCPSCRDVSMQLARLAGQYPQLAIYPKHFPQNHDCNPHGSHKHSNACRAAQAAEAAGILRGPDAFWEIHKWLFEHDGKFTLEQLRGFLAEKGYDAAEFERLMDSDTVRQTIADDCAELAEMGYSGTPVVFVNGVSLLGWSAPDAIARVVAAVAATDPPPRRIEDDLKPRAAVKFVSEWQVIPPRPAPPPVNDWSLGPADAPARIVMFGDPQQPDTRTLYGMIRAALSARPGVRFSYRHMIVHPDCNPAIRTALSPSSCRSALAVEAAGQLGGSEAFWATLEWILEHQGEYSDEALLEAAPSLGFEAAAMLEALDARSVRDAVLAEAAAARRIGVDRVPVVFVNDKWIPTWKQRDADVLGAILDAALRGEMSAPSITATAAQMPPANARQPAT
ncbi:MAG: thioredoxin domain-containing protein, partial [Phycisphaerae bacterium]|nr:thioredoxin domain-containing protein [Phycisphaerae bacterium]